MQIERLGQTGPMIQRADIGLDPIPRSDQLILRAEKVEFSHALAEKAESVLQPSPSAKATESILLRQGYGGQGGRGRKSEI